MTSFASGLTGSFSQSAAQNPTVRIMEAGYAARGLDIRYINCEVAPADLAAAVSGAVAMGWLGFNCSLPHKESVIAHLDELAPSAAVIGAVNTVVIDDGRLIGENTDGKGFVESLSQVIEPAGSKVVIFGAGGAARAIAVELALAGADEITVLNRSRQRGEDLVELLATQTPTMASFIPWATQQSIPEHANVVINATSVGFYPHHLDTLDVDLGSFPSGAVVADVVPNPPRTRWLDAAEQAGCVTLTGIGMLVNQALVNARLWTGETLDAEVMHRALSEALGV